MKNLMKKPLSIAMAALVALGGTGIGVYAANESNKAEKTVSDSENTQNKAKEEKDNVNVKDETVYILSNADGSVRKIIVSDWLQNALSSASLKDNSQLENIVNVKGEQGFTSGEDGSKQWNAEGEDIYYTGEISKELPVNISVKYFLDGKELSADEMKGKSGRAVIRFEYTNNQYETVKIDGRDEKIYVPFAVLTGALLDNNIFRNVEVSEGKIINDGDRTVIVGMAFPGLQDSLNIDKEKLEIPDYFEITADVRDFEMSETLSVATNEIFNNIDLEDTDSIGDLNEDIKKLTDAVDQLSDGSVKLYDGLNTLLVKSSELIEGIDKLVEGAGALKNGTSDLVNGSVQISQGSSQLYGGSKQLAEGSGQVLSGSSELAAGLGQLANSSSALNAGSKQVFDTLLAAATAQIKAAGLDIPELTVENYRQVLEQALDALNALNAKEGIESIKSLMAQLDSYNEFYAGLNQYTAGVDQAAEGALALKEGAGALNKGAMDLNNGAGTLNAGAEELNKGAVQLDNGAKQLYEGLLTLQSSAPALIDGITQLRDGAKELSEGMTEFKEQGVQKLIDAVDGDISGLVDRIKAVAEVSKGYNSFSGIDSEMIGKVKFVYRTDSISKED